MEDTEKLDLHRGALLHRGLMVSNEAASEEELLSHVLWYYPLTESGRERLRWLSMVEGILALGDAFGTGMVDSALLEKSRIVLVELEPELWMAWSVDKNCDPKAAQSAILQIWDSCWTLFYGPLIHETELAQGKESVDAALLSDRAGLKANLQRHLPPAMRRLWKADVGRLADLVGFEHSGADAGLVLCAQRAQSLARQAWKHGSELSCSIFLGANLVWNGLELADSLSLYRYLVAFVLTPDFPSVRQDGSFVQAKTRLLNNPLAASRQRSGLSTVDPNGLVQPPLFARDNPSDTSRQHIWYLKGYGHHPKPPHDLSGLQWFLATRASSSNESKRKTQAPKQMCLYQAGDWTLVILAPQLPSMEEDSDFLSALASATQPLIAAPPRPPRRLRGSPVDGCDFVYFNRSNLALKLGFDPPLRPDAHRVLDDALSALAASSEQVPYFKRHPLLFPSGSTREICVPLLRKGYLIAKLYDKRLVVLILDSRFADFQQAQDAAIGLKGGLLSNIAIFP